MPAAEAPYDGATALLAAFLRFTPPAAGISAAAALLPFCCP